MLIRIDRDLEIIKDGTTYKFHAGDVIQSSQFPEAEKLIKAQQGKGRIEKNVVQPDT